MPSMTVVHSIASIIEIVGGLEQTQQTFEVLLPLEGCDEDYQLTSAVSVSQIVSPIPHRDLSVVMLEAYQEYVAHCTRLGNSPISHDFWPSGSYGGKVEILLGVITHSLASNKKVA